MYFDAKISVTIGNKLVKQVVYVKGKNDRDHLGSDLELSVPLICRIQYTDGKHDYLTDYAKNLFSVGDLITLKAWYVGYPEQTVFVGYVYDFVEGTPMVIKCIDTVYLLNQKSIDVHYSSISLRDLIKFILKDTGVTLMEPSMDLMLEDITFRMMSPAAILEWLKKEMGINVSLQGSQLYVNVASNTLNTVILKTDRNVLKSDLQKPDTVFSKYKLKAWFVREDGTKDSYEVGDPNGQLHEVFFYKIRRDEALYKQMANEALIKYKQMKYSGTVETLLYPFCDLFWQVTYMDKRYPERNANYVVTGRDFTFDGSGYHYRLKLAFLSDIIS